MNIRMAVEVVEALEPYARRLLERAEGDEKYQEKWFLAWQQALLVVRAYDAPPDEAKKRVLT